MNLEGFDRIGSADYNFSEGKREHDISVTYFGSKETYDDGAARKYVIRVNPNLFVNMHCSPTSFEKIKGELARMIEKKPRPDRLVLDIEYFIEDLFGEEHD